MTPETTEADVEEAIEPFCSSVDVQYDGQQADRDVLVTFTVTDDEPGRNDAAAVLGRLYATDLAVVTVDQADGITDRQAYQVWLAGEEGDA